ncbi:YHYH domain-containing protein [Alcaligenaceae bacterium 429]|nr:YHYH domain-containing protein [Alcaligenaceae bacterium 429]
MRKTFAALSLVLISLGAVTADAWAHSGRTDKNGCHMDRKAGTRHCH